MPGPKWDADGAAACTPSATQGRRQFAPEKDIPRYDFSGKQTACEKFEA
jgi:hypothetical protein